MSPRTAWEKLPEAHKLAAILLGIFGFGFAAALLVNGYVGVPERLSAVESRATSVEAHDREQDAVAAQVDQKLSRIICLLESQDGSPLRCER